MVNLNFILYQSKTTNSFPKNRSESFLVSKSSSFCLLFWNIIFVPTFEENGIFMLDVVFFYSVNFRRSKEFLTKIFKTPLKISTS